MRQHNSSDRGNMQPDEVPDTNIYQPTSTPPRKKSWWGRNWFWVVPVGCLTPILACGGFFALIISLVFGMIKSSYPYEDSLATLQQDQRVVTVLGSPIEAGFMVTGQVNLNNNSGNADIYYSVTGPLNSASVHVVASKSAGQWTYQEFSVAPESTGQSIDMLAKP